MYGMRKGDMVKSRFGEFHGMKRKHPVVFVAAKCVHTTAILLRMYHKNATSLFSRSLFDASVSSVKVDTSVKVAELKLRACVRGACVRACLPVCAYMCVASVGYICDYVACHLCGELNTFCVIHLKCSFLYTNRGVSLATFKMYNFYNYLR